MFHWRSDFLFAQPDFFSGMARLFDFGGRYDAYNISRSIQEADFKAILSDWSIIGQDLKLAIDQNK
jgi:hypothetical protein